MKFTGYCKSCNGTGISHGFAEGKGFGVVCSTCKGTGAQTIEAEEFKGRRTRDDIEQVGWRSGWDGQSTTQNRGSISYKDFLAGKLPPKSE